MLSLGEWLLFLFLWRPLLSAVGEGFSLSLPAPQNLTIKSYNFQNVLSWSPVKGINGPVFYRVQRCLPSDRTWEKVNCRDITKPECDFESIKNSLRIILRVRAEEGNLKSEWSETDSFVAQKDTIIGPPRKINVTSEANTILISFLPPFEKRSNFSSFDYTIYWENSENKAQTMNTVHKFKDLKERTTYCFRIQAKLHGLEGEKSGIHCAKTTITDGTRILHCILIFIFVFLMLALVFLLLMIIRKYQNIIKSFWQPPLTIPTHYTEDLNDPEMITIEEFHNSAAEDPCEIISVTSKAEDDTILTSFASEHS
ncbi:PREDICTED: interferon gamma receptor 2-like [Thamnophis sirtalis]|uniref:Interferon gamma receptor 2-like n=1 Tax=Thamnophis sirtalis TaxID=35019 RepID=A0A6I9XXY4_9SAUR|nr:PREDICTED: interferon gamma receptor 2-like [Thamnophis sirtalis]